MGMDVTGARQKFKQCRQPNYCLVSYRRRDCSSADTGAYSKARKRLSLTVLQPLLKQTADALQMEVKPSNGGADDESTMAPLC